MYPATKSASVKVVPDESVTWGHRYPQRSLDSTVGGDHHTAWVHVAANGPGAVSNSSPATTRKSTHRQLAARREPSLNGKPHPEGDHARHADRPKRQRWTFCSPPPEERGSLFEGEGPDRRGGETIGRQKTRHTPNPDAGVGRNDDEDIVSDQGNEEPPRNTRQPRVSTPRLVPAAASAPSVLASGACCNAADGNSRRRAHAGGRADSG